MRRFAWWPVRVSSGRLVWLAHYWYYQTPYDANTGRPPLFEQFFTFSETDSERTFRLLKETVVHNRNVWNHAELTKKDYYA